MKVIGEDIQMEIENLELEIDMTCFEMPNGSHTGSYDEPVTEVIEIEDDIEEAEALNYNSENEKVVSSNGEEIIKPTDEEYKNKDGKSNTNEKEDGDWDLYTYLLTSDQGDEEFAGGSDNSKKYVCYDCGFQTNYSEEFSTHNLQHENEKAGNSDYDDDDDDDDDMLECLKCDYQTKNKQYMKNHMRNRHLPRKTMKCRQCDFKTRSKPQMSEHIKTNHNIHPRWQQQQRQQQQLRQQQLRQQQLLQQRQQEQQHQQREKEVKYFECTHCEYRTKWKHHIKEHNMFHHNEGEIEWFKCPVSYCDYQTKWKYHIKQHVKCKHSAEDTTSKHQCAECGFCTEWKPDYLRHLTMVHGLQGPQRKMHQCPECPYKTNNSSNLKVHIRSRHRKEDAVEIFMCDQCNFHSKWKHHIINHKMMKHPDAAVGPLFRCDECDFQSKWKHIVIAHKESRHAKMAMRQHQNDQTNLKSSASKMFCNQCSYSTFSLQEITQHIQIVHTAKQNVPNMNINAVNFNNRTTSMKFEYFDGPSNSFFRNNGMNNHANFNNAHLKGPLMKMSEMSYEKYSRSYLMMRNRNESNFVMRNYNNDIKHKYLSMNKPFFKNVLVNRNNLIQRNRKEVNFGNHTAILEGNMYDRNLTFKNNINNLNNTNNNNNNNINNVNNEKINNEVNISVKKKNNKTELIPMLMLKCNECVFETDSLQSLRNHVLDKHHGINGAGEVSNDYEDSKSETRNADEITEHVDGEQHRTLFLNGVDTRNLPPEISITPVTVNK